GRPRRSDRSRFLSDASAHHLEVTFADDSSFGSLIPNSACEIGNVYVTIGELTVLEYLDRTGSSPFADWFRGLDATAAAKITTAIRRLEQGNFSSVKGVGAGVFECRIDFGPGYRVYFGKDGEAVVILLGGGTK